MPTVYALECENKHFYIAKASSQGYIKEIDAHFQGDGVSWTKLHKPVKLVMLRHFCDENDDVMYTKIFMRAYGVNKARGGSFQEVVLTPIQLRELNIEKPSNVICSKCYLNGHVGKVCPFIISNPQSFHIEETNINNTNLFTRVVEFISKPVKYVVRKVCCCCCFWGSNDLLSMRFGRSGSFRASYPDLFETFYQSLD